MPARNALKTTKAALIIAVPLLGVSGCVTSKKEVPAEASPTVETPVDGAAATRTAAIGAQRNPNGNTYTDPTVNAANAANPSGARGPWRGFQAPPEGSTAAAPGASMADMVMQPTGINAQAMSIFSSRQPPVQNNTISTTVAPADSNAYVAPAGGIAPARGSVFSQPNVATPPLPKNSANAAAGSVQPIAYKMTTQPYATPTRSLFGGLSNLLQTASLPGMTRMAPNGVHVQNESVQVSCFKPKLMGLIHTLESHYGKPVVVSSGYRDPEHNKLVGGAEESMHKSCDAADIQIAGVSKWDIAAFTRALPDRGGVGTYCHTESVHIDIGNKRDWNWGCSKNQSEAQPI
ncbi:YcbK family protein [Oryzifoliimicrobium ureilyticus]|uniref:YcbK family protein n=1 Tax=Oryzifoliimicrobium ureilyticus TaxID=3113724 RepID=UPI003075F109